MNKRLAGFLAAENVTQSQFADTLKVAKASVSNIISGRNKPGFDFLESLSLHYPELNLDWLINGRGRMYKDQEMPVEAPESLFEMAETPVVEPKKEDSPKVTTLSEPQNSIVNQTERCLTRVLLFYSDGTFESYEA